MPNSFHDQLQSIIQKHVSRAVGAAVDGATKEAIAAYQSFVVASLGGDAPNRGPGRPTTTTARVTPKAKPAKPGKAKPKTRGRRSSSQITATLDRVLTYLDKHPGQTSEKIQKGMGGDKKVISDALARLRGDKKIKTAGVKRSMTYTL